MPRRSDAPSPTAKTGKEANYRVPGAPRDAAIQSIAVAGEGEKRPAVLLLIHAGEVRPLVDAQAATGHIAHAGARRVAFAAHRDRDAKRTGAPGVAGGRH